MIQAKTKIRLPSNHGVIARFQTSKETSALCDGCSSGKY